MKKIETVKDFIEVVDGVMSHWDFTYRDKSTNPPVIMYDNNVLLSYTLTYDRGLHPATIKVVWDRPNHQTHVWVNDIKQFTHAYTCCLEFPSSISIKSLLYGETLKKYRVVDQRYYACR